MTARANSLFGVLTETPAGQLWGGKKPFSLWEIIMRTSAVSSVMSLQIICSQVLLLLPDSYSERRGSIASRLSCGNMDLCFFWLCASGGQRKVKIDSVWRENPR